MDRSLRSIKLRARFEQIERRAECSWAQRCSGCLVVAVAQPCSKSFAANGPGLTMTLNEDVGISGAGGGVEELATQARADEHGGVFSRAPC